MPAARRSVFPSKRDWWLEVIVWLSVALMLWTLVGASGMPTWAVALTAMLGAAMLWFVYGTGYSLSGGRLQVRTGPLRWKIPLAKIRGIEPSRNPISSPAMSLDRLHVEVEDSAFGVLISPADKEGFMNAVVSRATHLRRDGDRVVPRER